MSIDDPDGEKVPCNHSPGNVGPNFCSHTSSVPARAGACVGCTSPWKTREVTPVADPEDGLPTISKRWSRLGIITPTGGGSVSHGMVMGNGVSKRGNGISNS